MSTSISNTVNYVVNDNVETGNVSYEMDFWDRITDRRVNQFYFARGGPGFVISVLSAYLIFVLYLGPTIMKNRKPFKLNKPILVYNLLCAGVNLWLFIHAIINEPYKTIGCLHGDIEQTPDFAFKLGYIFYLTKYFELLDTVFFVLRKKDKQITFLHVFHHTSVPFICWAGFKFAPGGPNGFFPVLNTGIHVVMYLYYALSTLGPKIQPYLWWKKYLTRMQMSQFVLVIGNAILASLWRGCKFPMTFIYIQAIFGSFFLLLFGLFYRNAYSKKEDALKKID